MVRGVDAQGGLETLHQAVDRGPQPGPRPGRQLRRHDPLGPGQVDRRADHVAGVAARSALRTRRRYWSPERFPAKSGAAATSRAPAGSPSSNHSSAPSGGRRSARLGGPFRPRLPKERVGVHVFGQQGLDHLRLFDRREVVGQQPGGEVSQFQEDRGEFDVGRRLVPRRQEHVVLGQDRADLAERRGPDPVDPPADLRRPQLPFRHPLIEGPMDPGVEHQPPIAQQRVARGHGRELVAVGPGDQDHLRRQVVALPQPKLPLAADLQQRLAANDQALAMRDLEGQGWAGRRTRGSPAAGSAGSPGRPPGPPPPRPARSRRATARPPTHRGPAPPPDPSRQESPCSVPPNSPGYAMSARRAPHEPPHRFMVLQVRRKGNGPGDRSDECITLALCASEGNSLLLPCLRVGLVWGRE